MCSAILILFIHKKIVYSYISSSALTLNLKWHNWFYLRTRQGPRHIYGTRHSTRLNLNQSTFRIWQGPYIKKNINHAITLPKDKGGMSYFSHGLSGTRLQVNISSSSHNSLFVFNCEVCVVKEVRFYLLR